MKLPDDILSRLGVSMKIQNYDGKRKRANNLIAGFFCVLGATGVVRGAAPAMPESDKLQREQSRLEISTIDTKKNIADYDLEFERVAGNIRNNWSKKNKELNAELMLELCGKISSGRFGKTREHGLARKYALSVLEEPEVIPVETEMKLVGHVGSDTILPGGPEGQAWADQRRADVKAHLHAWKRMADTLDPNWNPSDLPSTSAPLPPGVDLPPGVAPESIKDPKLRAEYEASIEKNNQKARKYSEQYSLRNLQKSFLKHSEKYVVNAYSKPPLNADELNGFLQTYVADQASRERILKAVAQRISEKTKHFEVESGTTPFRGHPKAAPGRTKQTKPRNQEAPH